MRQSGIRTSGSPAAAATVSERGAAALAHVRGSVSLTAHASAACCLMLVLATTAGAQGQLTPIIRVELRPAALPSPALRYHLLPHLSEQTPGDGALLYMQAITAKKQTDGNGQEAAARSVLLMKWEDMPLKDLPRDQVRRLLDEYKEMFDLIDRAARCETCDWKLLERIRRAGIATPQPELQGAREFADFLAVRIRLEVTEGRFDKAVRDLQTGFALARQVAEQPTWVNYVVGTAIAAVLSKQLDTIIQQPGSPNLYWALADLPRPLLNIRRSFQGERVFVSSTLPGFDELAAGPDARLLPPEQLRKATDLLAWLHWDEVGSTIPRQLQFTRRWLLAFSLRSRHEAAKRALLAVGWPRDRVEALPLVQIALLHSFHEYKVLWDETMKWESFPYWEAYPHLREMDKRVRDRVRRAKGDTPAVSLAGILMPGVPKFLAARVRTDRKIAALRCLEAIRLYAARNGGKLPASLGAIKKVPVPIDPVTGKEFEYHVKGDRARLYGPPPEGEKPNSGYSLWYELTLKR